MSAVKIRSKPANQAAQPKPAKRGRPKGAKTLDRDVVEIIPACCQRCGSTTRRPYDKVRERAVPGNINGKQYTHVVWRRTACLACGQARVERHYENR